MKHFKKGGRRVPWQAWLVGLALLCVGGAELIACYHYAPATFTKITAPARAAADGVSHWWDGVTLWWADFTAPREVDNGQEATGPAIENSAPVLDPAITELTTQDGVDTLTGGVLPIVYFNQGEEPWASLPYGTDDIARYGCGPAAMAMAVASFTGQDTDPAQMAKVAVSKGYWAKQSGSYLSIVEGLAAEYGLKAQAIPEKTAVAMEDALLSGKLLVALMGPGHFTEGGHFILIRGITLKGTLLVADPNSTDRSLQEWDPQLILDELSKSTANGAPLWTLEAP